MFGWIVIGVVLLVLLLLGRSTSDDQISGSHGYRDKWLEARKDALWRAGYCCEKCGNSEYDEGVVLQVHHIKPLSMGGDNSISNLIVLCKDCHENQHGYQFDESFNDDYHYGEKRKIKSKKLQVIDNAIEKNIIIKFRYKKYEGEISERRVIPKEIYIGKQNRQYIRAFDLMRNDERNFRISRIISEIQEE